MATLNMTTVDAHKLYKKHLSRKYPKLCVDRWNTVESLSDFAIVLNKIIPSEVPEALRRAQSPWKWHPYYTERQRYEWVTPDGWVTASEGPGSAYTLIEWYSELVGISGEGGYNDQ